MNNIFVWVLNMSITASFFVLAVFVLRLFLRKSPKWIICLLWGIVALRLVVPFSIESNISLLPHRETITVSKSSDIIIEFRTDTIDIDNSTTVTDSVPDENISQSQSNEIPSENTTESHTGSLNTAPTIDNNAKNDIIVPQKTSKEISLFGVLSFLWICGMLFMLVYSVVAYIRLYINIKATISYRDNVYYCDSIDTPFIFGFFRPKIYIPSDLSVEYLEYVISHENAHIKRGDYLWKPIGVLLLTVHWFNPLIWAAYILLCRDIESACDEKVIRDMNDEYKKGYSTALLVCSVHHRTVVTCPVAFGETGVKTRIKSVLSYKRPAKVFVIIATAISVILSFCFITTPKERVGALSEGDKTYNVLSREGDKTHNVLSNGDWVTFTNENTKYTAKVYFDSQDKTNATYFTVTNADTGALINNLTIDHYENLTDNAIYAVDITFDGNFDLVIPYHMNGEGDQTFSVYVWDVDEGQFVQKSFWYMSNFSLDYENKYILSHRKCSGVFDYYIHYYNEQEKDFDLLASLCCVVDEQTGVVRVEERHDTTTVKEFQTKTEDYLSLNPNDINTIQYFKEGSYWDLNSDKWNRCIPKDYNSNFTDTIQTEAYISGYMGFLNGFIPVENTDDKKYISRNYYEHRFYIGEMMVGKDNPYEARFAYYDIDNNGIPEMILESDIYDIFTYVDGKLSWSYETKSIDSIIDKLNWISPETLLCDGDANILGSVYGSYFDSYYNND